MAKVRDMWANGLKKPALGKGLGTKTTTLGDPPPPHWEEAAARHRQMVLYEKTYKPAPWRTSRGTAIPTPGAFDPADSFLINPINPAPAGKPALLPGVSRVTVREGGEVRITDNNGKAVDIHVVDLPELLRAVVRGLREKGVPDAKIEKWLDRAPKADVAA